MTALRALDRLDLALLRAAKRGRERHGGDDAFYEAFFTDDDARRYLADARNAWRHGVLRAEFERTCGSAPARVADVGCGFGLPLGHLPATAEYTGVERSARTLARARALHAGRHARFVQGGFPVLPLPAGVHDFVICLEVLEHLADDGAAVAELARITRPGGWLLVSVPCTHYWPAYLGLMGHHRHYTPNELATLLAEGGFVVEHSIAQHTTFWRWYHYAWIAARAAEAVVRRTVAPEWSLYDTRVYRVAAARVLHHLARRAATRVEPSTFVLARRRPEGP